MKKKETFSLRKYKIGTVSVLEPHPKS
ncbi:YSIRK-type signal peptide-containing protein [Streptococcus suis]